MFPLFSREPTAHQIARLSLLANFLRVSRRILSSLSSAPRDEEEAHAHPQPTQLAGRVLEPRAPTACAPGDLEKHGERVGHSGVKDAF